MRKIIVTGKNGGLSVAVAEYLRKNGFETENLGLRGEEWKNCDFSKIDAIVHLAGLVPKDGVKSDEYYNVNFKLTEKLAEKAKAEGVKQFVYISTMAVYGIEPSLKRGEGVVYAQTECAPVSDYGKSKLLAEKALEKLKDDRFKVATIRVPSIYGVGKTEYLKQYGYSFGRLKFIPKAFTDKYKSIISVDNLSRLVYLLVANESDGVFCPDDGKISAFDICRLVMPEKKPSAILGLIVKLLSKSRRVTDYYGAVCYDESLTDVFNGDYRVRDYETSIKECYEK